MAHANARDYLKRMSLEIVIGIKLLSINLGRIKTFLHFLFSALDKLLLNVDVVKNQVDFQNENQGTGDDRSREKFPAASGN